MMMLFSPAGRAVQVRLRIELRKTHGACELYVPTVLISIHFFLPHLLNPWLRRKDKLRRRRRKGEEEEGIVDLKKAVDTIFGKSPSLSTFSFLLLLLPYFETTLA